MPSKRRQLRYLGFRLLGWLAWLPLIGNPWHDRTYGEVNGPATVARGLSVNSASTPG